MHKPHDYPLRIRFWHFVRGLLFYNTVYWKRASDELKPPRLSREERASLQPAPDPDIVRPRERPRSNPLPAAAPSAVPPRFAAIKTPPSEHISTAPHEPEAIDPFPMDAPGSFAAPETGGEEIIVKRRRYRRRKKSVHASRSPAILVANKSLGLLARLFGHKDER